MADVFRNNSRDLPDETLPEVYHEHRLLQGSPYYTLPHELLDLVVRELGPDCLDTELLRMDYALSDSCGDHTSKIGIWGGGYIEFDLLRTHALGFPEEDIAAFVAEGWSTREHLEDVLACGNERLQWIARVRRAYCGWLMTNRQFLEEHRELFQDWTNEVATYGIPVMGNIRLPGNSQQSALDACLAGEQVPDLNSFLEAFEKFFTRWRLDGMPAPFLPRPLSLHLPVGDLRPLVGHMREAGTTLYLPDIFPVPSRDELRKMMEESLRSGVVADHLSKWNKIVQSDSAAKNRINRFARIFEVQHYLRALYSRHCEELHTKKTAIKTALATFLGVSFDTLDLDMQSIAASLGPDWYPPRSI